MTILNLHAGSPLLSDLIEAIDGLQAGVRVGVQDQAGNLYRLQAVTYDTTRMALLFAIDTTRPIVLPTV